MLHRLKLATMIALMFLTAGVACGSLLPLAQAGNQPRVQLGLLVYPSIVRPGANFGMNVSAWYSGKFLADIGVWDRDSGLMVQSMTFISQFTGPGNVTFTLPLTAPDKVGPWHLLIINRVWWQNAWYQDPKGGEESFTVSIANNVVLMLGSSGAGTQISVDGIPYPIADGSFVIVPLALGPHVLDAPMVLQKSASERFVFNSWSDGVASDPYSIFLSGPAAVYAQYRTEYYLSAQSEIGEVVGVGWYAKGTEATVAVPSKVATPNLFGLVDEYRFSGWSGDSTSAGNVATILMDGPKQLTANWVIASTQADSRILAAVLLLLCVLLFGRLVFLRFRRCHSGGQSGKKSGKLIARLACLFLILLLASFNLPSAHAQLIPQPRASIVHVGNSAWYYWDQPGSDTCLIWLGGGIPEVSVPGSYGYLINPYEYESFDTLRFIQDLTSFYCVIALQQGSVQSFDPAANRTIYQELFQPQTTTLEQLHQWILEQGYVHTFVVGYSVGGQAAAADFTLGHPDDWTTQDGLILITVPFSQDLIVNANQLRTNLLVMYGGNLPDYEATGIQFYNSTPTEGLHADGYFHKGFRVLSNVGHEAWTVRATGTYDTAALNLIIGFIEQSKALQLHGSLPSVTKNLAAHATAEIVSVKLPALVRQEESFLIDCNTTASTSTGQPLILAAYDTDDSSLISQMRLSQPNESNAQLVVTSSANETEMHIIIVVFTKSISTWAQASNAYSAAVVVTDLTPLTVQSSYPGVGFLLDGKQYITNSTGLSALQVPMGQHLLQAQPFVYESNVSRLRFVRWGDAWSHPSREILLPEDSVLEISYVQQYFVRLKSPYGQTTGSGWYDANSNASVLVQPPILNSPEVVLSHWSPGANLPSVSTSVLVSSPLVVSAVWSPVGGPGLGPFYGDPWFILSLLAFMVLIVLNVRGVRRGRENSDS